MGDLMTAVDEQLAGLDRLLCTIIGGADFAGGLRAAVLAHREALQARIATLEAEMAKPVAGAWRDTAHGRWRLDMGGFWALKWNTDGWSVWIENHTRMAHGPETGPEAEALADEAARPFWRLT